MTVLTHFCFPPFLADQTNFFPSQYLHTQGQMLPGRLWHYPRIFVGPPCSVTATFLNTVHYWEKDTEEESTATLIEKFRGHLVRTHNFWYGYFQEPDTKISLMLSKGSEPSSWGTGSRNTILETLHFNTGKDVVLNHSSQLPCYNREVGWCPL